MTHVLGDATLSVVVLVDVAAHDYVIVVMALICKYKRLSRLHTYAIVGCFEYVNTNASWARQS